MSTLITKLFDSNEREVAKLQKQISAINALEPQIKALSDQQLRAKTEEFRQRVRDRVNALGEEVLLTAEEGDTDAREAARKAIFHAEQDALNELLPEAFAVVRQAAMRTIGQRHYDVQLIGGLALHQGRIAEMKT
ncbi:MAG: preprotein translocase subunit SecA, partial [Armatimonadetes bacterium]|nr:preprotein translocase subunit SecA [Armatimonadota bacterium]